MNNVPVDKEEVRQPFSGITRLASFDTAELRIKAERTVVSQPVAAETVSKDVDMNSLLHELQVHQIELEMQNAELRQTRDEMEKALETYTDLYNFTPVGYFTLDRNGVISAVNLSGANLFGSERARLLGRYFGLFVTNEYRSVFTTFLGTVFISQGRETCEVALLNKGYFPFFVRIEAIPTASGQECRLALINITGRKQAEEKQKNTFELLRLCTMAKSTLELMRSLMLFFQDITGCEAVGVRLQDGHGFPYYETRGFPEDMGFSQNHLCDWNHAGKTAAGSNGNPVLDCMCGTIIYERYDPSKPFFTAHGSFWSSCITELLARTTEADRQAKTRNRCNNEGYESVALIPIRFQGETFGLFQFNDTCKGRFTVDKIAQMEDLVDYVAIALAKLRGDEALKRSEQSLLEAQEVAWLGSYVYNIPRDRWTGTTIMDSILGIDPHHDRSAAGWGEVIHPSQRTEILAYLKDVVEQKLLFDKEYRIKRKNDGAERWVHTLGRLEYDSNGSPIRMTGSLQDITARKQAEEDLRSCARRLLDMEEGLKKKLAAELHDEIGRDLTALGINMTLMRNSLTKGALKDLRLRITDSETLLDGVRRTTRNIMASLRPTGLDDLDLVAALNHHMDIFSHRSGIAVSLDVDEAFPRLASCQEIVLFRIVQESLTNIAKHAEARCVVITLRDECRKILLSIHDDGRGFALPLKNGVQAGYGMGLKIMQERAEMIGGTFHLTSLPGSGTTVSVRIEDNRDADD